jgi:hypothetical protein
MTDAQLSLLSLQTHKNTSLKENKKILLLLCSGCTSPFCTLRSISISSKMSLITIIHASIITVSSISKAINKYNESGVALFQFLLFGDCIKLQSIEETNHGKKFGVTKVGNVMWQVVHDRHPKYYVIYATILLPVPDIFKHSVKIGRSSGEVEGVSEFYQKSRNSVAI